MFQVFIVIYSILIYSITLLFFLKRNIITTLNSCIEHLFQLITFMLETTEASLTNKSSSSLSSLNS